MKELKMYYGKNDLVGKILWAHTADTDALVSLVDPDGVVLAQMLLSGPMTGESLSKLVPDGLGISVDGVVVADLRGPLVRGFRAPFDTDVRTERQVMGVEERMARLENGLIRRLARMEKENAQLKEKENVIVEPVEPVVEASEPADPPKEPKAAVGDPAPQGATDAGGDTGGE